MHPPPLLVLSHGKYVSQSCQWLFLRVPGFNFRLGKGKFGLVAVMLCLVPEINTHMLFLNIKFSFHSHLKIS